MELWFAMENIYYYGQNFGTIPKTMELWFAMENIYYYGKNFGTIVNYSFNSIFFC